MNTSWFLLRFKKGAFRFTFNPYNSMWTIEFRERWLWFFSVWIPVRDSQCERLEFDTVHRAITYAKRSGLLHIYLDETTYHQTMDHL